MADFAAHFNSLKSKASQEDTRRQQQLENWHLHEKSRPHRRSSIATPIAGSAQQLLYEQNYGKDTENTAAPAITTASNSPIASPEASRQQELENWHRHQKSLERRSSSYNQTAGKHQNKLYEKYYGQSTTNKSSINQSQQPLSQHQSPSSPAVQPLSAQKGSIKSNFHYGKAQLREQYEYRMHKDRQREVFAVTMNNNKPGAVLRSGVISVLPQSSGPKKVEPLHQDPTRAGCRSRSVVETKGDQSIHFRPHEKQVSPGYKIGYAGQSSEKLSYITKCAESRRGHSPEAHHRIYHTRRSEDHFPWHSPDAKCVENQKLKSVSGPERDHVYDIIAPHKYDEFESLFDPSLKHAALQVNNYEKERRTGKKCNRIALIERVHPLDTGERIFPTHRIFDMHEHHHGKKHVQHQGDHIKERHMMEGGDGNSGNTRVTHSLLNDHHHGRKHLTTRDHIREKHLL
jgi:hypothetical protein